ncbi:hypothetical protein, partial [Paraburkholderia sp. SIMBA_027]|uniref:hypothetical protein n=1 Tax=Paraburkholderia sp. SIMBA_027 TaxID=3085770 RepID=UPI00397D6033
LLNSYGIVIDDTDSLELTINIQEELEARYFSKDELRPYLFRNRDYLLRRGITDEIMKKFIIGYDKDREAVAFFWLDAKTGKVAA